MATLVSARSLTDFVFNTYLMPRLLRACDNRNQPLVQLRDGALELSYFNVLRLRAGESLTLTVPGCELLCVALAGAADVSVAGQAFEDVGRRAGIWSVTGRAPLLAAALLALGRGGLTRSD